MHKTGVGMGRGKKEAMALFPAEVWRVAREAYTAGGGCHDFSHIERVYRLALRIAEEEGADQQIVGLAALFHDIGRPEEEASQGLVCHAEAGARKALVILQQQLGLPESLVEQVCHCIAAHRFRKQAGSPLSLEAKCLYDADKLDSLGAVGVARAYLWLGERGGAVYRRYPMEGQDPHGLGYCPPEDDSLQREWKVKLKKIKDRLYTEAGRRMARQRHRTMQEFLYRLEREVMGEE